MKTIYIHFVVIIVSCLLSSGCQSQSVNKPDHSRHVSSVRTETTAITGQGINGSIVTDSEAAIRRLSGGVSVNVYMPVPEPVDSKVPRIVSVWLFVINYSGSEMWDGAYHVADHYVNGEYIDISGYISSDAEPVFGEKIADPEEAQLHIAVVPHVYESTVSSMDNGSLPAGTPEEWWFAIFE